MIFFSRRKKFSIGFTIYISDAIKNDWKIYKIKWILAFMLKNIQPLS